VNHNFGRFSKHQTPNRELKSKVVGWSNPQSKPNPLVCKKIQHSTLYPSNSNLQWSFTYNYGNVSSASLFSRCRVCIDISWVFTIPNLFSSAPCQINHFRPTNINILIVFGRFLISVVELSVYASVLWFPYHAQNECLYVFHLPERIVIYETLILRFPAWCYDHLTAPIMRLSLLFEKRYWFHLGMYTILHWYN